MYVKEIAVCEGVVWFRVAQNMAQCSAVVNTVLNYRDPLKVNQFLVC
jgi:hypothetical protein